MTIEHWQLERQSHLFALSQALTISSGLTGEDPKDILIGDISGMEPFLRESVGGLGLLDLLSVGGETNLHTVQTKYGELIYDSESQIITTPLTPEGSREVKVGPSEGALIMALIQNERKALTHEQLAAVIAKKLGRQRTSPISPIYGLKVRMASLRKKIGDPPARGHNKLIHTVRGQGYILTDDASSF